MLRCCVCSVHSLRTDVWLLFRCCVAWQVVLDHGMYRRLDQNFREAYCRLWKGMILADGKLVEAAAREMGLGVFAEVCEQHVVWCVRCHVWCNIAVAGLPVRAEQILPLLFVYRPVSSSSTADIGKNMSAQQRDDLKRKFKGTTMQDVNKFMRQLPRDMLFVMRATNLVRCVLPAWLFSVVACTHPGHRRIVVAGSVAEQRAGRHHSPAHPAHGRVSRPGFGARPRVHRHHPRC